MFARQLIILFLGATAARAHAQVAADLYTLELVPAPELMRFSGYAELRPAASPFSAPVTRAGVHRYDVVLHIETVPAGARIFMAGQAHGQSPADVRLPKGGEPVTLELQRDGYARWRQTVVPDVDQRFVITLQSLSRARPRAPTGARTDADWQARSDGP